MLSLNTTNKVTFNVNVFGTAATPTVRCVIGEAPGFSFPATKLEDGQYEVLIDLPKDLRLGTYPFKVEVLLNGRLFTPINHDVPVTGPETPVPAPVVSNATPDPTASIGASAAAPSLMASVTAEKIELVKTPEPKTVVKPAPPVAEAPAPAPAPVPAAVAAPVAPAPALNGLKKLADTPVFSKPAKIPEAKRSTISMADVANAAAAKEPKVKQPVKTPQPVAEAITPTVPVSLTKGAVIYR